MKKYVLLGEYKSYRSFRHLNGFRHGLMHSTILLVGHVGQVMERLARSKTIPRKSMRLSVAVAT